MAEVYTTPEGFRDPPEYEAMSTMELSFQALQQAEKKWLEELVEWCRANTDSRSELIGEVIRFPRGDGTANYMVFRTKPLSLLHIPLGDAWDLPDYQMRGLRVKDIQEIVRSERAMQKLFASKRS
jgi:hypothetical protein